MTSSARWESAVGITGTTTRSDARRIWSDVGQTGRTVDDDPVIVGLYRGGDFRKPLGLPKLVEF